LAKKRKIPEGLTKAARQTRDRFLEARARFLEQRESISLSVLVWGQHPKSTSEVGKKRREIKQELIDLGHYAVFSEELAVQGAYVSHKVDELAQAHAADVIIALIEDSLGALGETHEFGPYPDIAPKFFVLAPSKYQHDYSGLGILRDLTGYGKVHWYKPPDLKACKVLDAAVRHVETIRNYRFCQNKLGAS
jgi:hypothetical protein